MAQDERDSHGEARCAASWSGATDAGLAVHGRRRAFQRSTFYLCLVLLVGGCAPAPQAMQDAGTCATPFEILQAVADDPETETYAAAHLESRSIAVLWNAMPPSLEACGPSGNPFSFTRSSSPSFDPRSEFIAIDKLYFDADAAFLEISFPPTGKNGDFFLRRKAGKWVIAQKALWES
ncbi:hypothetical protein [Xanthomonas tesorieronis]|uniref:hypothetical protein n=1 Tax=Xanthomonas tesorieronis TaxID=3160839 RepID=UPI00351663D4